MINNLRIKKKLISLGITTLALVDGAIGLGCTKAEAQEEDIKAIISMLPVESNNEKEEIIVTATPTMISTSTPTSLKESESTATPEPTEAIDDSYTLTDEEAIEIGTYAYDNYISRYTQTEGTAAAMWADNYTKEDIINYVCVVNQKYPALYPDLSSSCIDGDLYYYSSFLEVLTDASMTEALSSDKPIFPYFILLKEGREDRKLLQELHEEFVNLAEKDVSSEEVYKYWGKVFKLAANPDETFKDWDSFNLSLFYYTVFNQYLYWTIKPEKFDYADFSNVPSNYLFDHDSNVGLDMYDAFYYVDTTTKDKYPGLTDLEYDTFVGGFDKISKIFVEENVDGDNYILQRIKNGN